MKKYLIDTNIISETRKRAKCNKHVLLWTSSVPVGSVYLSVLVIGEIRKGIEKIRRRDPTTAPHLERWLSNIIDLYKDRILPVNQEVAEMWGRINVPDKVPTIDGLLSATAMVYGLTFVTRNTKDVERTGVDFFNPYPDS